MKHIQFITLIVVFQLTLLISTDLRAEQAKQVNGVTTIHLDQYGGYFETKETLGSLKAGTYEFVVTNKTNKLVGFQLQNNTTKEQLDKFPLEPNQTRVSRVEITTDGFRFRCPINPTPWYEIEHVKGS